VVLRRHQRRFAVALVVSIAAHIAIFVMPAVKPPPDLVMAGSAPPQTMNVELMDVQRAAPPEPVESPVQAQPKPTPPPPPRIPMPPLVTPRIVRKSPNAIEPEPPPSPRPPEPRPPPIPELDMAAMIEARRAQRRAAQASAPRSQMEPTPDQLAQANINRNLRMDRGEGVGGVFEILRKGTRTAEFAFNGWRPDTERRWREVIEVDAGVGGDVERAIVKRMIELIRTHYNGDFRWDSHTLGRVVVLSARPEDQSGLEDFMMREFFGAPPPPSAYRR
jgi:outer membrane biosynthesis protein TonB